jgi:response regulator RpfG family c-di-GMP phosphodiesterase
LLARVLAIADAYDVMTRGRPYKDAISKEEAIFELRNCAEDQFDPELVELFIKLIND